MTSDAPKHNRQLAWLVLGSLGVFVTAVVLRLGIGATPFTTTDSIGRPMGFNDPLSLEHYWIMARNFDPLGLLKAEYFYEWVLVAAHITGAILLLAGPRIASRKVRRFFAAQVMVFPLGIPAILILPPMVAGGALGRMDREGFVDIPFIAAVAHSTWVMVSVYVAFVFRGESLGWADLWRSLRFKASKATETPHGRSVALNSGREGDRNV